MWALFNVWKMTSIKKCCCQLKLPINKMGWRVCCLRGIRILSCWNNSIGVLQFSIGVKSSLPEEVLILRHLGMRMRNYLGLAVPNSRGMQWYATFIRMPVFMQISVTIHIFVYSWTYQSLQRFYPIPYLAVCCPNSLFHNTNRSSWCNSTLSRRNSRQSRRDLARIDTLVNLCIECDISVVIGTHHISELLLCNERGRVCWHENGERGYSEWGLWTSLSETNFT